MAKPGMRSENVPNAPLCGGLLRALRPALLPSSLPFFRTVRPLHDLPTFFSGPRVRPLHDLPTFFRPGQEHPKPAKVACWLRAQRLAEKRRKWGRLKRESCQIVLILHVLRLRDPPTLRSNPAVVSERLRWTSLGSDADESSRYNRYISATVTPPTSLVVWCVVRPLHDLPTYL